MQLFGLCEVDGSHLVVRMILKVSCASLKLSFLQSSVQFCIHKAYSYPVNFIQLAVRIFEHLEEVVNNWNVENGYEKTTHGSVLFKWLEEEHVKVR